MTASDVVKNEDLIEKLAQCTDTHVALGLRTQIIKRIIARLPLTAQDRSMMDDLTGLLKKCEAIDPDTIQKPSRLVKMESEYFSIKNYLLARMDGKQAPAVATAP